MHVERLKFYSQPQFALKMATRYCLLKFLKATLKKAMHLLRGNTLKEMVVYSNLSNCIYEQDIINNRNNKVFADEQGSIPDAMRNCRKIEQCPIE